MVRRIPSPKRFTLPPATWRRHGTAALLGMVLLFFSAVVTAQAPFSTTFIHISVVPPSEIAEHGGFVDRAYPAGPHCHHGHATRYTVNALVRTDLEFEPLPMDITAQAMSPRVVVTSGKPRTLPDPSPVPVYLLTRRLRS